MSDETPKNPGAGESASAHAPTSTSAAPAAAAPAAPAAASVAASTPPSATAPTAAAAVPVVEPPQWLNPILAKFEGLKFESTANRPAVRTTPDQLIKLMSDLKSAGFNQLFDHLAVDWLAEQRFELHYHLCGLESGLSLIVIVSIPREEPVISSVSAIWPVAIAQEREVYDLMGVLYSEHPDLRRLFLEDDWKGFPLRKDYQDDFMVERPKWLQ
jgi:NADH-quinone oxidoreductase subunit C